MKQYCRMVAIYLFYLLYISTVIASDDSKSRERVTFNFGWKFRTGLKDWAVPDEVPPKDVDPGLHPPESMVGYNTSTWQSVQLPHDGLIGNSPSTTACPNGCSGKSYIPRHVLWYRKSFSLPESWYDDKNTVWLEFDGSFRNTTVWVDGKLVQSHDCGYTPFNVPLRIGKGDNVHTIAVFVDPDNGDKGGPDHGSGWWYEGGGLYRNVWLNKANNIRMGEMFVYTDQIQVENSQSALWATLHTNLTIIQDDLKDGDEADDELCVEISVFDEDGLPAVVSTKKDPESKIKLSSLSDSYHFRVKLIFPRLWSSASPYLYHVTASLKNCQTSQELDVISTHHGIRTIEYTAQHGFFLNKEHYKIRGFCDHNTFGVVGMAVPDRINLFRAQASRSIGGNGRRTSHNPPDPQILEIYDRLGMVVLDENRLFANNSNYVDNMAALVKRDRNHPSVILWSFCNENDCEGDNEVAGPAFQEAVEKFDGTRPTLANMWTFNDLLSKTIDVQGFSHESREHLDECHEAMPEKPIVMSECCSCNIMRAEDAGCETMKDNPHYECNQAAFNARCLERTVNASDGVEYAGGTFVWTLFDYYGEPPSRPLTVSSTYGQYDLVGFPKQAGFWFRSQWLLNITDGSPDKTFDTSGKYEVQLVESWESPDTWIYTKGNTTRNIHVYSNAPRVELFVNEKSQGILPISTMVRGTGTYAEFMNVTWEAGTLRAVARSNNDEKEELAVAEVKTCGPPMALQLSLDCPSPITGTGDAVLLDGQDVALVRASVVDERGQVVYSADNNITFTIISGPGKIQGTGNGNAKSYEPNNVSWQSAVSFILLFVYYGSLSKQNKLT